MIGTNLPRKSTPNALSYSYETLKFFFFWGGEGGGGLLTVSLFE